MMKKTLVALAAVAAAGAYAQSSVTLSGRLSMDVSTWGATGSATSTSDFTPRTRVADTSSRITFAAREELGAGSFAGVYCETGFSNDTATANGQAGTANTSSSEWCSREGRLFAGNDIAEIRLGRQNVWWTQGAFNDSGSNKIGTDIASNLFNGAMGLSVSSRGANMIMLQANKAAGAFAGSQIYTGYDSTGYEAAAASAAPTGAYNGFKLNYDDGGKFIAMVDYQTSVTASSASSISPSGSSTFTTSGAVNSFDRSATRYSVGYKYAPDSIVSLQYWNKSRTDRTTGTAALAIPGWVSARAANTDTLNQGSGTDSGYIINLNHAVSPTVMAIVQYGRANNVTGAATAGNSTAEIADSGATAYSLGGIYRLSKRTHVYGAMHQIQNGVAAAYGMSGGNYQSGTNAYGSTVNMTALGLQHNF